MNFRGLNYIQKDCEKVYFTELKRKHFTNLNTELKCSRTEESIVAAAISQCLVNPTLELELCRLYVRLLCQRRMPSDPGVALQLAFTQTELSVKRS